MSERILPKRPHTRELPDYLVLEIGWGGSGIGLRLPISKGQR